MKIFKEIIFILSRIANFCFGMSIAQLLNGNYKLASWILCCVSIVFIIGYFTERWSK